MLVFQTSVALASHDRTLDDFTDLSPWKALASDGVTASAAPVAAPNGRALRLAFDFNGVAGYAFARRALPLDLPENYELSFLMRGDAPVNTLEVKFADASGENVWWSRRPDFAFPTEWRRVKFKKRHITFAWGPTPDRTLRRAESVEFVVTAGRDGGKGAIEIADLTFRELPRDPEVFPTPKGEATSFLAGSEPSRAFDGDAATAWRSSAPSGAPQSFTIDLGIVREFGGLDIRWAEGAFASRYDVALSEDGSQWETVRRVENGDGGRDPLALPESEARFIRLDIRKGPGDGFAIADFAVKDLHFGSSPNAFVAEVARDAPRGRYPRAFAGEQTYWTLVGVDGGGESGLLSEDGALEVGRGGVSIEPFVVDMSGLVTWADVEIGHSLREGYLPIPTVTWRRHDWDMAVTTFAEGALGAARMLTRYTVTNRTDQPRSLRLALAVRPFQVNPPTQSLNVAGGVSPIKALRWDGRTLWVNGEPKVAPLVAPDDVAVSAFDAGMFPGKLVESAVGSASIRASSGGLPPTPNPSPPGGGGFPPDSLDRSEPPVKERLGNSSNPSPEMRRDSPPPCGEGLGVGGSPPDVDNLPRPSVLAGAAFAATPRRGENSPCVDSVQSAGDLNVTDGAGLASGVLVYDLNLAPNASATVGVATTLAGDMPAVDLGGGSVDSWLDARQDEVANAWRAKLNLVSFEAPPDAQPLIDTLRSSLAHILMSRNGPILQPGTRSYNRSWIRDGAMISESLVRLGHANIAADYLRWFAPHQFANGKVPCCVDARGADPVPEHDSPGQLIFLAAEVYRYTGDRPLLDALWPRIEAATRYMDGLRASERTEANRTPERRMLYGLLPPSISHEGYAAKPAYSYWDGFWGLLGYKDAVSLANALGKTDAAAAIARERDAFRSDLYASLRAAAEVHGISYLPGAADLGDFDATSTTIALAPGGEREHLPDDLLFPTFERYWRNFVDRRDGVKPWGDYTPYELRSVAAFVRLGWRERALELLDYFMKDRRPSAWNQWAEVVGREARQPRFIGDMPHAWISSDYIRSALALFSYERQSDSSLVLAGGVPASWLEGRGVAVRDLRTPYGSLSYSLARGESGKLVLRVSGDAKPPGGFSVPQIRAGAWRAARRDNGQPAALTEGELKFDGLPAEIVIDDGTIPPGRQARE